MAVLRVDDFKAQLTGGGARANLFRATITFPAFAAGNLELTSFMCSAAQLPGSKIEVVDVPFRGRSIKIAGDRSFDPWTVTIINDVNFRIRNSMERWMGGMGDNKENTGLQIPSQYKADMFVEQLDKSGSVVKKYDFRGAFPSQIAPIDLSYETANAIEQFTVQFDFDYWEVV